MNRCAVSGLLAAAGLASTAAVSLAQAPTSAQVWDIRFLVDQDGPFAEGSGATAVGITLLARVGIRPNSGLGGTNNFGVARVGGAGTPTIGFLMTFSDAVSAGLGLSQGTIAPGVTAIGPFAEAPRNDSSGDPVAGTFFPFRDAFTPGGFPDAGDNDNPFNGAFSNPPTGSLLVTSIQHGRARGWNTVPTPLGVATLDAAGNITGGDYAAVYRFLYTPRAGGPDRDIDVNITGMSARYIFAVNGDLGSTGPVFNLPNMTFQIHIPGAGAAALMGLACLAAMRRRRA
jgi:hypothetical protein